MSWWGSQQETEIDRAHPEHDPLHDVWKLTALPRTEFDATYVDLWSRSSAYIDTHYPDESETFAHEAMTLTRAAMRVRQSQIVPRRIPTEEATRLSELMTFVLALTVMLRCLRAKIPTGDSPDTAVEWTLETLLSEASRRWICNEPVALEELHRFFAPNLDSELRALIGLAERRLSQLHEPIPPEPKVTTDSETLSLASRKAKGWRFLEWLRSELAAGELTVNEPSSLVHTLPGGETFIVVPTLFEVFAEVEGAPAKRIQNQVARLGLHRVVDGHNLFNANVSGRTVRGLILGTGAGLWSQVPTPNHVLRMRPVRAS